MNRNEWNNTATERNAKAEQWGAAIAILWFLTLFVLLPLAIFFPPILFLVGAGIIFLISKKIEARKNR